MIQWTSDLNTGISVIDEQHKRIVDFINDIEMCIISDNIDSLDFILSGLIDYTITHFAFEEELLVESGYPLLSGHRKVHEVFTKHIKEYQAKFLDAEPRERKRIARSLASELSLWLTNHIKRDDNDYVEIVQKHIAPPETKKGLIAKISRFFKD